MPQMFLPHTRYLYLDLVRWKIIASLIWASNPMQLLVPNLRIYSSITLKSVWFLFSPARTLCKIFILRVWLAKHIVSYPSISIQTRTTGGFLFSSTPRNNNYFMQKISFFPISLSSSRVLLDFWNAFWGALRNGGKWGCVQNGREHVWMCANACER